VIIQKQAPFSGHLYRIENREERLDFIIRIYAFDLLKPDGMENRSGKCELGDRIMDMGGGWVLTTLEPERLKVLFPNIEDMRSMRVRTGERAA
jgi:hypothetical protein